LDDIPAPELLPAELMVVAATPEPHAVQKLLPASNVAPHFGQKAINSSSLSQRRWFSLLAIKNFVPGGR
jgi:hypothetical protein